MVKGKFENFLNQIKHIISSFKTEVKDLMVMSTDEIKKQLQEEAQAIPSDQSHDHSIMSHDTGQTKDTKPPGEHRKKYVTCEQNESKMNNLLLKAM